MMHWFRDVRYCPAAAAALLVVTFVGTGQALPVQPNCRAMFTAENGILEIPWVEIVTPEGQVGGLLSAVRLRLADGASVRFSFLGADAFVPNRVTPLSCLSRFYAGTGEVTIPAADVIVDGSVEARFSNVRFQFLPDVFLFELTGGDLVAGGPPYPAHVAPPGGYPIPGAPSPEDAGLVTDLFYHQVYRARGDSPLNFTIDGRLLVDHASVPDGILGDDGLLRVYFVSGVPCEHGVWGARETETGAWERFPVNVDGGLKTDAVDPDIVRLADGRYRLFYFQGWFGEASCDGAQGGTPEIWHPIYSAISNDGINFTTETKLISVEGVTDPSVVHLPDGSWLMALSLPDEILFAASEDGYDYNLTGVSIAGASVPELALGPGDSLWIYVTATDGIRSLVSVDGGTTWIPEDGVRVHPGTADPSLVVGSDGVYNLFYKVIGPSPP